MSKQGETKDFIDIDIDFLLRTRQHNPDAWGTSQPHNSFGELSAADKIGVNPETRLDAQLLTKYSVFHPSFLVSPTQIKPDAENMITLDILKEKFGAGWQPTCAELNATEKQCKATWGGPSRKVRRLKRSVLAEILKLQSHRLRRVRPAPPHLPKSISILPVIFSVDSCAKLCRYYSLLPVLSTFSGFKTVFHDISTPQGSPSIHIYLKEAFDNRSMPLCFL